ncbi:hypothetical protein ACFX19_041915 [Malus domestica]
MDLKKFGLCILVAPSNCIKYIVSFHFCRSVGSNLEPSIDGWENPFCSFYFYNWLATVSASHRKFADIYAVGSWKKRET